MKQHERIRQLKVRELAKLLVSTQEVDEGDYDWDDEPCNYYVTYYNCPDGSCSYTEEDAIEHTIDWLNSEVNENE